MRKFILIMVIVLISGQVLAQQVLPKGSKTTMPAEKDMGESMIIPLYVGDYPADELEVEFVQVIHYTWEIGEQFGSSVIWHYTVRHKGEKIECRELATGKLMGTVDCSLVSEHSSFKSAPPKKKPETNMTT